MSHDENNRERKDIIKVSEKTQRSESKGKYIKIPIAKLGDSIKLKKRNGKYELIVNGATGPMGPQGPEGKQGVQGPIGPAGKDISLGPLGSGSGALGVGILSAPVQAIFQCTQKLQFTVAVQTGVVAPFTCGFVNTNYCGLTAQAGFLSFTIYGTFTPTNPGTIDLYAGNSIIFSIPVIIGINYLNATFVTYNNVNQSYSLIYNSSIPTATLTLANSTQWSLI